MVEFVDDDEAMTCYHVDPEADHLLWEYGRLVRTLPEDAYDPVEWRRHRDEADALLASDSVAPHYGRYVAFHRGRILGSRPSPIEAEVEFGREHGINPLSLYVAKAFDPAAPVGPDERY